MLTLKLIEGRTSINFSESMGKAHDTIVGCLSVRVRVSSTDCVLGTRLVVFRVRGEGRGLDSDLEVPVLFPCQQRRTLPRTSL